MHASAITQEKHGKAIMQQPVNARKGSCATSTRAHQWLDAALAERLPQPEQVQLFSQFEELSKTYAIDAPFCARTQLALAFVAFDGHKLQASNLTDDEAADLVDELELGVATSGSPMEDNSGERLAELSLANSKSKQHAKAANQKVKSRRLLMDGSQQKGTISWCKMLFLIRRIGRKKGRLPVACLMSGSDTQQDLVDLCQVLGSPSSMSLSQLVAGKQTAQAQQSKPSAALPPTPACSNEALNVALAPVIADNDEAELRSEALQIMSQLAGQLRHNSASSAQAEFCGGAVDATQQILMDTSLLSESGNITVCLLDKRAPRLLTGGAEAECARRWAQITLRYEELRSRLIRQQAMRGDQCSSDTMEAKLDKLVQDQLVGYMERVYAKQMRTSSSRKEEKLTKEQLEQVIELTKNNLNNLIDAQLLLRNKLTSDQRQNGQPGSGGGLLTSMATSASNSASGTGNKCHEYEILLRNNFNLLKVWQNLEETKRLACFVCEPIKSNLADLFWFSRQIRRSIWWPVSSGFNSKWLLSSPLVSLDGVQVKRGLLQILEALNYLHTICKLIHRNLNPNNILIASNDNWKLSGLDFAIRFESTAISESASMMAAELNGLLLRYTGGGPGGSGTGAPLRRQRTLHQTKCQAIIRRPKGRRAARCDSQLQPDIDYVAPEIWKNANCSHKSDMFSYALILAQTYDLGNHRTPINCRGQVNNYESELKMLQERAKRQLGRLVPFEMRSLLVEMLEYEPSLRPSANYTLQLFRRPIELCKSNDDSLRHLRSSLTYLSEGTQLLKGNNNDVNHINCAATSGSTSAIASACNPAASNQMVARKGRPSYFKKVTAKQASGSPEAEAGHHKRTRPVSS